MYIETFPFSPWGWVFLGFFVSLVFTVIALFLARTRKQPMRPYAGVAMFFFLFVAITALLCGMKYFFRVEEVRVDQAIHVVIRQGFRTEYIYPISSLYSVTLGEGYHMVRSKHRDQWYVRPLGVEEACADQVNQCFTMAYQILGRTFVADTSATGTARVVYFQKTPSSSYMILPSRNPDALFEAIEAVRKQGKK